MMAVSVALGSLLWLVPAPVAAHDHLVPLQADFAEFQSMQPYFLEIHAALLPKSGDQVLQALVTPSFEREWAVEIRRAQAGTAEVVCAVMKEQLWGRLQQRAAEPDDGLVTAEEELDALRKTPADVYRFSAELTSSTADRLEAVWRAMLGQARTPTEPRRILDGGAFFFFQEAAGSGYVAAMTRSPQAGWVTGALAQIVTDLRSHAGGSGDWLTQSDADLERQARELLARLQ